MRSNKADQDLYRRTLAALLPSSEGTINSVDDLNSLELAYDNACLRKWVSFKCQRSPQWTPELTLLRRQVKCLLKRAVRSNLLEDWASYRDAQRAYKRDIEAAKRNSWRSLCGHLEEVGPAAKLFRILRNGRQPATHNLRRPDGSYTARPGKALDCQLDSVCLMGVQDFVPPTQCPAGTLSWASVGCLHLTDFYNRQWASLS